MKVCWTGTFARTFERNARLREYLSASSIEVIEVHEDLWPSDRVAAFPSGAVGLVIRMVPVYGRLLLRLLVGATPDVYLVSYPGWFDVPLVKLVALIKRRPIVFDMFISLWDTAVVDRGLVGKRSPTAWLTKFTDRIAIRLSDRVIADCPSHGRFLADLAGVSDTRFGVVYLGADELIFQPSQASNIDSRLVVFYGTFVPLQGVDLIVRAARILEESEIRFRLIGDGQTRPAVEKVARSLGATNVEFVDFLPQEALVSEISRAALVLGVFGDTPKANRVIPHKLFEALATGCAILTGASEAVLETFSSREVAVCEPGDEQILAEAVERLLNDEARLRQMRAAAHDRFKRDFSMAPQMDRLTKQLMVALGNKR